MRFLAAHSRVGKDTRSVSVSRKSSVGRWGKGSSARGGKLTWPSHPIRNLELQRSSFVIIWKQIPVLYKYYRSESMHDGIIAA